MTGVQTCALPILKSSHRVEALARALGFATNAALRAKLKNKVEVLVEIRGDEFVQYLVSRGFNGTQTQIYRIAARIALDRALAREEKLGVNGIGFQRFRKPGGGWATPNEEYEMFEKDRAKFAEAGLVDQFLGSRLITSS